MKNVFRIKFKPAGERAKWWWVQVKTQETTRTLGNGQEATFIGVERLDRGGNNADNIDLHVIEVGCILEKLPVVQDLHFGTLEEA